MNLTQPSPRAIRLGTGKPSLLTVILGALAGAAQLVNQIVLTSPDQAQVRSAIAAALTLAAGLAIQPLFGPALTNALHLSKGMLVAISGALTTLTGLATIVSMSTAAHALIATVITVVGALLFGSPTQAVPPAPIRPRL